MQPKRAMTHLDFVVPTFRQALSHVGLDQQSDLLGPTLDPDLQREAAQLSTEFLAGSRCKEQSIDTITSQGQGAPEDHEKCT